MSKMQAPLANFLFDLTMSDNFSKTCHEVQRNSRSSTGQIRRVFKTWTLLNWLDQEGFQNLDGDVM